MKRIYAPMLGLGVAVVAACSDRLPTESAPVLAPQLSTTAIRSLASGQKLLGADGAQGNLSTLYELDPETGNVLRAIGEIGFAVTALAVQPSTGVLYGSTSRGGRFGSNDPFNPPFPTNLIKINPVTGAGIRIGPQNPELTGPRGSAEGVAGMAFLPDGTLVGWLEPFTDDLVEIDLETGRATVIGESGFNDTWGAGLAVSPTGVLYFAGLGDTFFAACYGLGTEACGVLWTIDPATGGPVTDVQLSGGSGQFRPFAALAFDNNGTLFSSRIKFSNPRQADLVTINTTTGAITVIGPTVNRLDAIVFVDLTPCEQLSGAIALVGELELAKGIQNTLTATLQAALNSVANDRPSAVQQLRAFINQVEAMRGNKLADEEADELVAFAQAIIEAIINGSVC